MRTQIVALNEPLSTLDRLLSNTINYNYLCLIFEIACKPANALFLTKISNS